MNSSEHILYGHTRRQPKSKTAYEILRKDKTVEFYTSEDTLYKILVPVDYQRETFLFTEKKVTVFKNQELVIHIKNQQIHNDDDKPALEYSEGRKEWYCYGQLHRENAPAITDSDGFEGWYYNGALHRNDGPAIKEPDGSEEYWVNGQKHRKDGPAIIRKSRDDPQSCSMEWYQHDKLHRDPNEGPAIDHYNGFKAYSTNGQAHRDPKKGPAIIEPGYGKEYRVHGRLHRRRGPAVVKYDKLEYRIHGQLHRRRGPAVIKYDYHAQMRSYRYFLNDKEYKFWPWVFLRLCYWNRPKIKQNNL